MITRAMIEGLPGVEMEPTVKTVRAIDGPFFSTDCVGRVYVSQCQGKDKPIFTTESQPVKTEWMS